VLTFRTTVELGGKTATGFAVPDEVVAALDAGKRPAVQVSLNGHTYRSTVATMGGRFMLPLSAENRAAARLAAGDEVEVTLVLDSAPREVDVPAELAAAFAQEPAVEAFFTGLAPSHRKEWVRWVEEAKKPETRATRVEKTLEALRGQRKTR
jgi:hypothetical protein